MEDGWESHVSPLMMGVGMGEMEGLGEMQAHHQEMSIHEHQEMARTQHHPAMGQEMQRDIERQDSLAAGPEYYSHQVRMENTFPIRGSVTMYDITSTKLTE